MEDSKENFKQAVLKNYERLDALDVEKKHSPESKLKLAVLEASDAFDEKQKQDEAHRALLLGAAASWLGPYAGMLGMSEPKPLRQCLLAGCEKETRHNGGYCCAEHCREDKKRLKI